MASTAHGDWSCIALHREAAAAGLPEAIRALALSSLKGEHVPLDAEAGLRGLLDAARRGDPFALEMVCNLRGGESIRYVTTLIRLPEGESLAPEIASQCAAEDDGG